MWCFPEVLLRASPPKAKRGAAAVGGPEARDASLGGAPHQQLSHEQLAALLPPPLAWRVSSARCDVVQVARAAVPPAEQLRASVEALLVPWLRPEFVFVQTVSHLLLWGEEAALREGANNLVGVLGALVTMAHVEAALDSARELGGRSEAQSPPPADPAAYGSHAVPTGGGRAAAEPRYAFICASGSFTHNQQKSFDHYRSRRGLARERRVVALRVQADGTASLLAANCDASFGDTAAAAAAAAPGRSVPPAVLSAPARLVLTALVGAEAQCRLQPGQAADKQVLTFAPEAEAAPPVQPPLIADRPWGLQLLLLMAAGHKDRTLRVPRPAGALPPGGAEVAMAVPMSVSEGLDWRLHGLGESGADEGEEGGVVSAGQRALLPRHALLKVALPNDDEARRLWAVGSSRMLLGGQGGGGGGGGQLVAVGGVTLLPPGEEFLAAVLLAKGGGTAAGGDHAAHALPPACRVLPTCLLAAAERVAELQPGCELREDTRATAALRELLDPWLATPAGEPEEEGAAADCPICYSVVALPSRQLPCVTCGTCRNRFHAWCIFRWISSQSAAVEGLEGETLLPCPLCRSQF